ncbi:phage integrase N-terminal SAM-like domain-containing protein [Marinobacterium aestuarii]|uniref:phage integrase N-terminal SAM-like domain-containing protein n=1 Tax=Marinobacterium aestuarii TaxID=1821621 RepID=UPI0012FF75A7|nr:phage integrase N-terminal SAM-like domain-containing protein [Marinobacterium aestuarii]
MDDIPRLLPAQPVRFMDRFRAFIRARQMAYRTEKTYCIWVRDFIRYHNKRHPESMGTTEVDAWLSHLANDRSVAINTQKTALNAVVFLYRQFLGRDLGQLQFNKASKGRRLPTVFSHEEAMQVLSFMEGNHKLAASLMYGSGLRVMEAVRLRVQDVDFGQQCLFIRETKGDKWRRTLLPRSLVAPLQLQIDFALTLHQQDLSEGFGEVYCHMRFQKSIPPQRPALLGSMYFQHRIVR